MPSSRSIGVFVALLGVCAAASPSNATDKITTLPNFPGGLPSFAMYR